tara:strand:+ start:254 stop:670 length:417 start_codon:yes stop_codon:yes gene_type:complete
MIYHSLRNNIIKLLGYEQGRFIVVGLSVTGVDLVFYLTLISIDIETSLSKGISFCIGATLAYFINRSFTFQSSEGGLIRFVLFLLLYLFSLIINVISNEAIILHTVGITGSILFGFIIATVLSATINYLGMKYIIFKT